MAQHFLLSSRAKTLSLATVMRMSDQDAEATFRKLRWAETDGEPVCCDCGGVNAYDCRRPNGAPRFRCRTCRKDFSVTSGTLFASHRLPLRIHPPSGRDAILEAAAPIIETRPSTAPRGA